MRDKLLSQAFKPLAKLVLRVQVQLHMPNALPTWTAAQRCSLPACRAATDGQRRLYRFYPDCSDCVK